MKKFVDIVTVTGADDSTNIDDLVKINDEFPYVEFAILLSRMAAGRTRFPDSKWIGEYINAAEENNFKTAGHLCGSWVREIFRNGSYLDLAPDIANLIDLFPAQRWQLNTHAEKHQYRYTFLPFVMEREVESQSIIFQEDGVNRAAIADCINLGIPNISTLFDLSHGTGQLPSEWPKPIRNLRCGYAGGLGPDNVKEQLDKLETIVGDQIIWIDAETRLRSDDDSILDIDRTRGFLENARNRVI